jgi:uncharacterized protein YxeA
MLKKVFAILMSIVILVMNMSFTFSTHYCVGEAVKTSFSIFQQDLSCGMVEDEKSSDCEVDLEKLSFSKKDCCENKHFTFQLSEECENHEYVNSNSEVVTIDFIFPPTTVSSFIIPAEFTSFAGYAPPEILKDFPSIFQIFRL